MQVQDLGQQLCWQLYVDNPGDALATGEFVHEKAAALDPSFKRPDSISYPADKPVPIRSQSRSSSTTGATTTPT